MPSPVDAVPCGSRSMISTCSPMAASAVPRLIAVVVLPTPPFWLASASTRRASVVCVMAPASASSRPSMGLLSARKAPLRPLDRHDAAARIGQAGHERGLDVPIFSGLGQFSLYILSLGEQGLCTSFQQGLAQGEEVGEGSNRAGSDHVDRLVERRHHLLDSRLMHNRRGTGQAHGLAQERGLFSITFNEM